MKKQDKTLEEELSKVELGNQPEKEFRVQFSRSVVSNSLRSHELGNQPDKEFRVVIIKMIKELKRTDAQSKTLEVLPKKKEKKRSFNKDL